MKSGKTRLELEIEYREGYRTPFRVKVLVALLVTGLLFAWVSTFDLKQELSIVRQANTLIKADSRKEKARFQGEIKRLETEIESLEFQQSQQTASLFPFVEIAK